MKKLIMLLVILGICCPSLMAWDNFSVKQEKSALNASFAGLTDAEYLYGVSEKGYMNIYAKGGDRAKQAVYVSPEKGYSITVSNDGTKAWFVMYDPATKASTGLFYVDGKEGTVSYVCEVQSNFKISSDGTKIVVQDRFVDDIWANTDKDFAFWFDVGDAVTGKRLGRVSWTVYNRGDEMQLVPWSDPAIMRIRYKPAGYFFAEAQLNLQTMEFKVIRDDSHLNFNDLPAEYKEDMHA